ncbi:MAG: type I methionyl aminopeptidase [Candidatus Marinimicrobia bacterium]|nr:type I methionyl aminopeptidase [Candidatus Neomarinimicrobiota bacterium]MCD6099395.1 type I methionyl aminopeptidase [Candidatus Neomarinimicrobiota bacterium]RKY46072.1 MAG: type I methionyl aminopeptidase [Candidatus Neomarinimicrobiota bacterium]
MIYIKTKEEIEKIRDSCRIAYRTVMMLGKYIKPGIKTSELNSIAEDFILKNGARPAFKGYKGYPATICTSINEEVVHGIPGDRKLKEGDIISVDIGTYRNGYYGDVAFTFPVGEVDDEKKRLMDVTRESLYKGIEKAAPGNRLSDISHAIQSYVEANGFSVVRSLVGHGIGRNLHESPEVPNYGAPGMGPELKPGMCLAIEPMVNAGMYEVYTLDDGWTVVTLDGRPSAHFEHTVAITENGPVILTAD